MDGTISYKIEVDNEGAIRSIHQVEAAAEDVGSAGGSAATGIDKMAQAADTASKIGATGLGLLAESLDRAVQRADILASYPKVMESLGVSSKDASASVDRLSAGIEGLPTTLDDAVAGTKRLFLANRDIDKSTDYFIALNNAIAAGGAPLEVQQNSLEQLLQSYSKGQMDQMEWLSIQNAMPQVLDQVAKAMGVTTEQLEVGLRHGEISMDSFMDTLLELNENGIDGMASLADQAKASTGGIATSFSNFRNSIVKVLGNVLITLQEHEGISAFFDAMKQAVSQVGKMVVWLMDKLEPLMPVLSALAPVIVTVVAALTAYEGITKLAAAAQNLLNLAMNANPIMRIVMLITTLVGAIIALWNNSEEFRQAIIEIWGAIKAKAEEVWNKIVEFFTVKIPTAIQTLIDWFRNLPANIKAGLNQVISSIRSWASEMAQKAREAAHNFAQNLLSRIRALPGEMLQMGINIVLGIADGIRNAAHYVWEALKSCVSGAWDKVLHWLGIRSPSRLFRDTVGKMIPAGIAVGIEEGADSYLTTAMDRLQKALSPSVVGSAAMNTVNTVNYYIGDIISGSERVNGAVDGLASAVQLDLRLGGAW